jgi:hypothetical protein
MKRRQRLESNEELLQRAWRAYDGHIPLHVRFSVTDPLPLTQIGEVEPPPLPMGPPRTPEIRKGQVWDSLKPLGTYHVTEVRWRKVWYEFLKAGGDLPRPNRVSLVAFQKTAGECTLRGAPPKPKKQPRSRTGGQYHDLRGQMISTFATSPESAWAFVRKMQEVCEFSLLHKRLPELS